jgi:hypothetical protein
LYESGCDDGSPGSRAGVVWVTLHREDESLEQAIRSRVADVQKAGCHVARVEIELEDLAVFLRSEVGNGRTERRQVTLAPPNQ